MRGGGADSRTLSRPTRSNRCLQDKRTQVGGGGDGEKVSSEAGEKEGQVQRVLCASTLVPCDAREFTPKVNWENNIRLEVGQIVSARERGGEGEREQEG